MDRMVFELATNRERTAMYRKSDYDWVLTSAMRANIIDEGDRLKVLVTLPGVQKDDIELDVKHGFVNVRVPEKDEPENSESPRYAWREFKQYGYERAILVGEDIIEAEVTAAYSNGILTVNVPKAKPNTVTIQ